MFVDTPDIIVYLLFVFQTLLQNHISREDSVIMWEFENFLEGYDPLSLSPYVFINVTNIFIAYVNVLSMIGCMIDRSIIKIMVLVFNVNMP